MHINSNIAFTYIFSSRKLTTVAVLGVLLGMSIYIFMNSLLVGFDKSSNQSVFRNTAHIRIYKDDDLSKPLQTNNKNKSIIVNPKVVPNSTTILNPKMIIALLEKQADVKVVTPQVTTNVFYNNGKSQVSGLSVGIKADEANRMFDIDSYMVDGDLDLLKTNPNGMLIGSGIAKKMNLFVNENINLTSSKNVNKTFKIVGIFQTKNSTIDKTKSYINLSASQQLLKENNNYITDINVNISDPENAEKVAAKLSKIIPYKVEGWKQANETLMATNKMRKMIITFVSLTILLVAGFGIYNILNMTVTQKINEIAILKAMGFKGKDVVKIFVIQAVTIGFIGVIGGVLVALLLITMLKRVYLGGDIGFFPIDYEPMKFIQGVVIGLIITFFAGYLPARKAANVDPVEIFRK